MTWRSGRTLHDACAKPCVDPYKAASQCLAIEVELVKKPAHGARLSAALQSHDIL